MGMVGYLVGRLVDRDEGRKKERENGSLHGMGLEKWRNGESRVLSHVVESRVL